MVVPTTFHLCYLFRLGSDPFSSRIKVPQDSGNVQMYANHLLSHKVPFLERAKIPFFDQDWRQAGGGNFLFLLQSALFGNGKALFSVKGRSKVGVQNPVMLKMEFVISWNYQTVLRLIPHSLHRFLLEQSKRHINSACSGWITSHTVKKV